MDATELMLAATNQLGNAAASYANYKQGEEALEENARQFDTNLDWMKQMYNSNLEFAATQHNEQMDFANRNLNSNVKIAQDNLALQQQAFDYQKELNTTQMEREDSAIQRQIADYQKAGFSPLAAIGGNGASTSALSSGAAPQFDVSGINQASGVYADFAKQYAALSLQARGEYMKGRSQLAEQHNAQVLGAKQALLQMKADMRYKNQSAATEMFNAAVNYKDSLLNRQYLRNQIEEQPKEYKRAQEEHDWYQKNGYYSRGFEPYIVSLIDKIAANKNGERDEITQFLTDKKSEVTDFIDSTWDKLYDGTKEKIMSIPDTKARIAASFYWTCIFKNTKLGKMTKAAQALYNLGKKAYESIGTPKSNGNYSFIELY